MLTLIDGTQPRRGVNESVRLSSPFPYQAYTLISNMLVSSLFLYLTLLVFFSILLRVSILLVLYDKVVFFFPLTEWPGIVYLQVLHKFCKEENEEPGRPGPEHCKCGVFVWNGV